MAAWMGIVGQLYILSALQITGLPVHCPYSKMEFKTLDYHHESDVIEAQRTLRWLDTC